MLIEATRRLVHLLPCKSPSQFHAACACARHPAMTRKSSPSPASPTISHAAGSQPSRVQPSGLPDRLKQPAAPQASCQLQPVGLQLCPVTANFQLHPSFVRASSSTQVAAVGGPQSQLPWETRQLLYAAGRRSNSSARCCPRKLSAVLTSTPKKSDSSGLQLQTLIWIQLGSRFVDSSAHGRG